MQQLEILHKRNLFIYFSLTIVFSIYFITVIAGIFEYHHFYPFIAGIVIMLVGILFCFKIPPSIMRFILLSVWDGLIVCSIISDQKIFALYWFLFFIIMASIYQSFIITMIVSLCSAVQAAFLLFFFFRSLHLPSSSVNQMYMFFLLLIVTLGTIQIIYIRQFWKTAEQHNLERERKLSSQEAYLQLFFEQAEEAIAVFDLDEKIIEVNPAFERLYGWSREECIGCSLPLIPPANKVAAQERVKRLLEGESFHLLDTQDMRKDGTIFDAQISLSPIYNEYDEMIAFSVISRDLSLIKENERLMMQSEKLKLAGEMAAEVAHEIRNPMTVVSGFVQMITADKESPYYGYTDLIQSEIERIDTIISDFLILSRPQADTYKPVDICSLLDEVTKLFSIELHNRRIHFFMEMEEKTAFIFGNANQIKQVFINLLKNAMEAIEKEGSIHILLRKDREHIIISLKDSGIGIPPHLLERIFEPFYTTKSTGTGLGMMITNKIITEHMGGITICSKEQVGTEVSISLPLLPSDKESLNTQQMS